MNEHLQELAELAELVDSQGEDGHGAIKMRTVSMRGTKYVSSRLGAMTATASGT